MPNKSEKLSLLQDLIALSRIDDMVMFLEEDFILKIAQSLEISELELNRLKETKVPFVPEHGEVERITQLYRLILLMGVDNHRHYKEIEFCKEAGLKMGLSTIAIDEILRQVIASESGTLSPEKIIQIFKAYHN